eukprot:TRINITY_DN1580_c0_g5_i1.p1 TRINITY_DN1580_c0_g5~~TRINITY_DN1580_c0_g5_i1.p1  ORF type:complete len:174 (+),score=44.76 TRINITY_DN1580_c0_g5_i1:176-697(+)
MSREQMEGLKDECAALQEQVSWLEAQSRQPPGVLGESGAVDSLLGELIVQEAVQSHPAHPPKPPSRRQSSSFVPLRGSVSAEASGRSPSVGTKESRSAAREYFCMTMSALNMIVLEGGGEMADSRAQQRLWEELQINQTPYHLWHSYLATRIQMMADDSDEPSSCDEADYFSA